MLYTVENTIKIGWRARVFLNERELQDVHVADTGEGKAIVTARQRDGQISINWKDGIVRRKVLRGKVRVELEAL
jgi:hypothetical protein